MVVIKILSSDGFFKKVKTLFYNNPSNTELNTSINDEKIQTTKDINVNIPEEENNIIENTNDDIDLFIKNTTADIVNLSNQSSDNCFQILSSTDNYYTTGRRRLLFKVKKNKFNYPAPKSTSLYYYPNLPILESLENTESIIVKNTTTTIICNGKNVDVPISIEYKLVNFKPYVSYSVALYAKKLDENLPGACEFDINNLDIYALEDDSLFLIPFEMCFPKDVPKFDPSQFLVTIDVVEPTLGIVNPVCEFEDYYLYEIQVEIKLELAPAINLDTINQDTLNILNSKLNKLSGNTLFTKLELDSFTEIDFSNVSNLDYNIFEYLPNLVYLDISNTNAQDNNNLSKLNSLASLETLIARNNKFTDLSQFSNLTNLIPTLNILDIGNDPVTPYAFSIKSYLDISDLFIFTNLTILDLSNNSIANIPTDFNNLSKLTNLNISYNAISDLTTLFGYNLELLATNQIVDYGSLYPVDEISPIDFLLELDFLKDVDYSTPCIDFISNYGSCYNGDSCQCLTIIWEGISEVTDVYFEFSNIEQNFSGIVNIKLNPNITLL
ncbi:MAG: leucine-rich repeat domain-containing protein [Peptostreptococcaceae bacterium]